MCKATNSNHTLQRAFFTALLLTGSSEAAEAAMLDAIASLPPETDSPEHLVHATIRAAVGEAAPYWAQALARTDDEACASLPPELQRVLHLPFDLRRCYVLRVLLRMGLEACAGLLALTESQTGDNVGLAVKVLGQLASDEKEVPAAAFHFETNAFLAYSAL